MEPSPKPGRQTCSGPNTAVQSSFDVQGCASTTCEKISTSHWMSITSVEPSPSRSPEGAV